MRCRRPTWPCIAPRVRARTSSPCSATACIPGGPSAGAGERAGPGADAAGIRPALSADLPRRAGPTLCRRRRGAAALALQRQASGAARVHSGAGGSREIVRVGEWVLREACCQVRRWQQAGRRNCTARSTCRYVSCSSRFHRSAGARAAGTGLRPDSLLLEITETLLMQDSEATMSSLHEIAALGVRLALDDFGTGYCSLGYLKRYPLHVLKVDRSFIAAAPEDPDSVAISRAVIGLGQSLGLAVVAEGVERRTGGLSRRRGLSAGAGLLVQSSALGGRTAADVRSRASFRRALGIASGHARDDAERPAPGLSAWLTGICAPPGMRRLGHSCALTRSTFCESDDSRILRPPAGSL